MDDEDDGFRYLYVRVGCIDNKLSHTSPLRSLYHEGKCCLGKRLAGEGGMSWRKEEEGQVRGRGRRRISLAPIS